MKRRTVDRTTKQTKAAKQARPKQLWPVAVSALILLSAAILWGSGTFLLNHSPLPELLATKIDSGLEAQLGSGYQVDVALPRFVAPHQVYVDEIRVAAPSAQAVALRGLKISFNWRTFLNDWLIKSLGRPTAVASPAAVASAGALPVSAINLQDLSLDLAELPSGLWQVVGGGGQDTPETPPTSGSRGEGHDEQGLTGLEFDNQALAGLLESLLQWRQESPVDLTVGSLHLRRAGQELLNLSDFHLRPAEDGLDVLAKTDWRRAEQPGVPLRGLVAWKISVLAPADPVDPQLRPHLRIEGELADAGEIQSGSRPIRVERASLVADWQGEELYVDRLLLATDDTRVNLEGVVRPGDDGDWRRARLALTARAEGVKVAQQLAFLAAYGISGTANFAGRLEGDWTDPVFSGTLTGEIGRLFDRPFRELTGEIQVSRESFVFHDATLVGEAWAGGEHTRYSLDGKIAYARPELGRPAALELAVATDGGRVEEWLPAFVPALDGLEGQVRGFLQLSGLVGDLRVNGDLELVDGSFRSVPFDSLAGRFRWRPERLQLETAELQLGTTQVTASGSVGPDGLLAVDVVGREVPLELAYATAAPSSGGKAEISDVWTRLAAAVRQFKRGDLGSTQPVAGNVNLSGRVTGRVARPAFVATVSSQRVHVGPVEFSRSSGQISWDGKDLTIPLLYMNRVNGGTYNLQGVVHDLRQIPRLDMQLEVSGEPVPELIEVLGGPSRDQRFVQLALVEGWFRGQAHLTGSLAEPQAVAALSVDKGRVLGRPIQLRLDLSYVDGKVRVDRVNQSWH